MTFVTYFDVNYAARGLTLIESMFRHHTDADVTVLCLDAKTEEILKARHGPRISLVSIAELEAREPALTAVRTQRTPWEYYTTQTPILVLRVLDALPPGALAIYIDADCLFFSRLDDVMAELDGASIGMSEHRFNEESSHLNIYGFYNGGFGVWRNDANGRACLLDWRKQCLDWCGEKVDGNRFLNQGYLTSWPERFRGVKVFKHAGQNLAPWNVGSHKLELHRSGVRVDGYPLVFYHYSGVFRSPQETWQTFYTYQPILNPVVLENIYRPYCNELDAKHKELQKRFGIAGTASVRTLEEFTPVLDLTKGQKRLASSKPKRVRKRWLDRFKGS